MIIGPSIIAGFGFSVERTTLLNMVPGACTVVGVGIALVIARHTNRTIAGIYTLVLSVVGVAMMLGIPSSNINARYGGYILTMQCKSPWSKDWLSFLTGRSNFSPNLCPLHHHIHDCRNRWVNKEVRIWRFLPTRLRGGEYHWTANISWE